MSKPLPTKPRRDEPAPDPRRHPLRFMWQMDADGRFSLGSDEFTRLIGARTAAGFGRPWSEIAEAFGLDPDGRVAKAIATRDTWSGITLNWPVDGGGRLPVELSGLPVYDRARNFAGYRGFGVCRDLDGLTRLAALRRYEFVSDPPAQPPPPFTADLLPPNPPPDCLPRLRPIDVHRLQPRSSDTDCRARLHNKPIWKRPWKRPRKREERAAVSAHRRTEIAGR